MKRLARAHSSTLFLLELVCSILIFAVTCAACIGLLSRSHSLSEDAEQLNLAVREVCSAAELVRGADNVGADPAASGGSLDALVYQLWPSAQREDGGWLIYYDGSGASVSAESGGAYVLQISVEKSDDFLLASLVFSAADGEELYSQQIERYMPEGGEADA